MRLPSHRSLHRSRRRSGRHPVAVIGRALGVMWVAAVVSTPASAQEPASEITLYGVLVDAMSREPVPEAWVEVDGTGIDAVTDSIGGFVLPGVEPGEHTIVFRRLGYYTTELTLRTERERSLVVAIPAEPIVLEGITVQVSRLDRRLRAVASPSRVFEGREIMRSATSDPVAFVRGRLGVPIVPCRFDPSRDCVYRRGRAVRPAIYVDEAPVFGGLEAFRGYPLDAFYRVEVIGRGTMIRAYTRGFMARLARGETPLFPAVSW